MKHLLKLSDWSKEEIWDTLQLAIELKEQNKKGIEHHLLKGKTLGMIFQKSSTRTRVSFEVGMYQLGGQALFLSSHDLQIDRGEPIEDTARVLSRFLDGILIRTYSHKMVEDLAKYSDVPVINGLTDDFHPTQVIADLITIKEHKGTNKGLKFAYVGDGNNMVHSLMIGGAKVGMNVAIASPEGYLPNAEVVAYAKEQAALNGVSITITQDPFEAVADADVVYTDTWASMGQEAEKEIRAKIFAPYQINQKLLDAAKKDAIVMHCLPAYRGYEITNEVIEGAQSVVFDEAENRMHAHKAILAAIL